MRGREFSLTERSQSTAESAERGGGGPELRQSRRCKLVDAAWNQEIPAQVSSVSCVGNPHTPHKHVRETIPLAPVLQR